MVCLTVVPPWLRRGESKLGNLSYGIYLNHFMVAGLLLWLMEAIGHEVFGFYASAGFGISLAIASSLVAALTFYLVEHPVELLRRKLKGSPGGETVPAGELASPKMTPAE